MEIVDRFFQLFVNTGRKEADLARFLGVGTSQISTWKKRRTDPPAKYIASICEFFEISPIYLLTGENTVNENTDTEEQLLSLYRRLHPYDQRDLLEVAQLKADRVEREGISQQSNNSSGKTA